jgi:hypothetical protein
MRRSLTTPDRFDLAAIRQRADVCDRAGDTEDVLALLDAIAALLALPTPMHPGGVHEEFKRGYDSGFNAFRREARRLFGVGDD